jgi:hypothetical protein
MALIAHGNAEAMNAVTAIVKSAVTTETAMVVKTVIMGLVETMITTATAVKAATMDIAKMMTITALVVKAAKAGLV